MEKSRSYSLVWGASISHIYMCHKCAKRFLGSSSKQILMKISTFHKTAQILYTPKNCNLLQYLERDDPSLLIYRFYGRNIIVFKKIYF